MTPRAFVFDLDDTLASTSGRWQQAEAALLRVLGHEWSPELAACCRGRNAGDAALALRECVGATLPEAECRQLLRDALFVAFESAPIQSMPGARQCVEICARQGPIIVASGSPLPLIRRALGDLGLDGMFAQVVTSEDVARGKPFPDVFLMAAEKLGVPPSDCLVFEDSLVGVQAACGAGMAVYVVPTAPNPEFALRATRVLASLADVTEFDLSAPR